MADFKLLGTLKKKRFQFDARYAIDITQFRHRNRNDCDF